MAVRRGRRAGARQAAALALSYVCGVVINHPLRVPTSQMPPERIWSLTGAALADLLKLSRADRERVASFRRGFSADRELEKLSARSLEFVALGDPCYPESLAMICDPPAGLFIAVVGSASTAATGPAATGAAMPDTATKGAAMPDTSTSGAATPDTASASAASTGAARLQELLSGHRIAIVGARGASRYGLDVAERLAAELAARPVCIISGMALGVDAAAHRGALAGGGRTVAVLGGGADRAYPRANYSLYRSLLKSGAVVSEYPPGTLSLPWRFPARNRIIAGMAEGVIVVEARQKSGALITADFCLEQGKDVFAVPGSVFSELSMGPIELIRQGATPVASAADVFESLGMAPEVSGRGEACSGQLSDHEELILRELDTGFCYQDVLAAGTGLSIREVAAALLALELKGLARHDPGRGYSR